ncbi:DUF1273 domain-containing protein [Christensenellaceae bacterium OttesenSCG-928-M15]|nr:DUF1273 domain-containing protein [Christensenellaceae bacterium OttesenSCG-928-M15]
MSRETACCFSGHRPHKFHFGYDEKHRDCMNVKLRLSLLINEMYRDRVQTFYTGMAEGVDLWAADYVCELKAQTPFIRLVAVIPYEGQPSRFTKPYQALYERVRALADEEVVLHESYRPGCMQERNRYMVDHASRLIAVYNGTKGGTHQTVCYAKEQGLEIITVDPREPLKGL